MKFTAKLLFVLLSLLLTLSACIPGITKRAAPNPFTHWNADEILYLSPPDSSSSEQHLVALYFHDDKKHFTWRFDFLQIKEKPTFDLYFVIDYKAGGNEELPSQLISDLSWDYRVHIQSNGEVDLQDSEGKGIASKNVSAAIDPDLDSIVLDLNAKLFKNASDPIHVQAYLEDSISLDPIDQTPVLTLEPLSPPPQASVLLSFYDVLPAYTPAQALRYWYGAHSGPFGGRHGLKLLLDSADRYHVPLVLLDLKNPASLSALDYLGQTQMLVDLERRGLVSLPDPAFGDPGAQDTSLSYSHKIAENFGYSSSQAAYVPVITTAPSGYAAVFSPLNAANDIQITESQRYIPVKQEFGLASENGIQDLQATADGLSVQIKQALLQNALASEPGVLMSLGGSLHSSPWGDSMIAPLLFRYLACHPWIKVLRAEDLASMPAMMNNSIFESAQIMPSPEDSEYAELRTDLHLLPPNNLTDAAWLAYLRLTRQTEDPDVHQLQLNYMDIVRDLVQSARWADSPTEISTCDQRHCILAGPQYFASIQLQGGGLSLLAHMGSSGAAEWISSSAQFIVGLSDPSQWRLADGLFSDPMSFPGAFSDTRNALIYSTMEILPQRISLISKDGGVNISYSIDGQDFKVTYESATGLQAAIPIAYLPHLRFNPGWQRSFILPELEDASFWQSSTQGGTGFSVKAGLPVLKDLVTFKDTFSLMTTPEDPNQEYSTGHYLPFPMAVLSIESGGGNPVIITFSPVE